MMSLLLVACADAEITEQGVIDNETGIEYVHVAPRGLYALSGGDELFTVKNDGASQAYLSVDFEDSKRFICIEDSGEYLLLRAKDVEEPTLATFNPIAALIYNETNTTFITNFYADREYLPEGTDYNNQSEDSDLCRLIADTITNGEAQSIPNDAILEDNMFFIRLLSKDYPGLYYSVCFYGATDNRYYITDRATRKTVLCPNEVIARMVGN